MLAEELADPGGYGRVMLDAGGRVAAIVEHKDADAAQRAIRIVNTGVLAAPAAALKRWLARVGNRNAQGEYYLTDVYALAAADGQAAACVRCLEAGEADGANDPWQLAQLERRLQQRHARALALAGVRFADPARFDQRGSVEAGRDVEIDVDVVLEGKVTLGDGVRIGPYCRLRDVTLAAGTRVHAHCDLDGVVSTGAALIARSRWRRSRCLRPRTRPASTSAARGACSRSGRRRATSRTSTCSSITSRRGWRGTSTWAMDYDNYAHWVAQFGVYAIVRSYDEGGASP